MQVARWGWVVPCGLAEHMLPHMRAYSQLPLSAAASPSIPPHQALRLFTDPAALPGKTRGPSQTLACMSTPPCLSAALREEQFRCTTKARTNRKTVTAVTMRAIHPPPQAGYADGIGPLS